MVSKGHFLAHRFDVDVPFPEISIPLLGEQRLAFDFGVVYKHTYRFGPWGTFIDYTQLPARFETYSPADQARIQNRMAVIAEAHARGDDLEHEF
jgi:hypothetical protein